jgi:hypothetical protein
MQIGSEEDVPDVSPPLYKLRKAFFRSFPPAVITQFARLKKHWYVRMSLT